jgi:tetratricopeptide (TPR) repeat protein
MTLNSLSVQKVLKRFQIWMLLPAFGFVLLFVRSAIAQQAWMRGGTALHDRIVHEIEVIHAEEQAKGSSSSQGTLWALLASDYEANAELSNAEAAYNQALRLLQAEPDRVADYATVLDNLGSLYILMGNSEAAEKSSEHSLAVRKQLGNQLSIARGEAHLAEMKLMKRRFKEAERESSHAYETMVALPNATGMDIVSVLIALTYENCLLGKSADAVASAEKAVTVARDSLPADALLVAEAHLAFGFAQWKAGAKEGAEPEMRAGLEILRARMPTGHPEFLAALEQYRKFLVSIHRQQDAKQIAAEETQLAKERSRGCNNCTVSVYALSAR